jgi:hypothetical protein
MGRIRAPALRFLHEAIRLSDYFTDAAAARLTRRV